MTAAADLAGAYWLAGYLIAAIAAILLLGAILDPYRRDSPARLALLIVILIAGLFALAAAAGHVLP